ncbi:MAG: hypothetical protein HYU77_13945 [Betaproteobacteria bacterium]|nr:hypothetical protein [Betaproteobacteria bacterium]
MNVDTLFLLAGPRSAGKTKFIQDCGTFIGPDRRPPELQPFFEKALQVIHLADLDLHAGETYAALRLHADMFTPFAYLPACSEFYLRERLTVDNLRKYRRMESIGNARTIFALILRIPRRTVLRRWIARSAENRDTRVHTNLAHIYSDASGDALFDRLYDVWYEFIRSLGPAGVWDVEEQDGKYTLRRRV